MNLTAEEIARIVDGRLSGDAKKPVTGVAPLDQATDADLSFVNEAKFKGTVDEMVKGKSAKFGENIEVRRFARFEVGRETSFSDRTQKKA